MVMTSSDEELVTAQANEVTAEELANYQLWDAPSMVSVSDVDVAEQALMTAEDIDKLQKEAEKEGYKSGFNSGLEAGKVAGKKEIDDQVSLLQQVLSKLNTPLDELDQKIEHDLISLVTTMTRQLVRREIATDPEFIVSAVREALTILPINDCKLKVYLNPEDIELVKSGITDDESVNWQWIDEPSLSRGGCRLETIDTSIDASIETRLERVITKLLAGENMDDSAK